MMKAGVKSLIIFMAGFGASGGLTGALTYYFTKKKFMKISDERVKSLEEYIEELQMEKLARDLGYGSVVSEEGETDGKEAGSSEGEENYIPKEDMNFNPNRERPLSNIKAQNDEAYIRYSQYSQNQSKIDERYNQIAAELEHPMDSGEDDEYEREMAEAEEWTKQANSVSPPIILDENEYDSTGYLDAEELIYYTGDKTVIDESEQIITDVEALLGNTIHESGFDTNSEKYLYVRNYRRSTDYMVTKVHGSYSDKDIY